MCMCSSSTSNMQQRAGRVVSSWAVRLRPDPRWPEQEEETGLGVGACGVCHTMAASGHTYQARGTPNEPPPRRRPAGAAGAWEGSSQTSLETTNHEMHLSAPASLARLARLAQPGNPLGGLKPGRGRWSLPFAFHAQEPCYRTCLKSRQDPTF